MAHVGESLCNPFPITIPIIVDCQIDEIRDCLAPAFIALLTQFIQPVRGAT